MQTQNPGGAVWSINHPVRLLERVHNMLAFDLIERPQCVSVLLSHRRSWQELLSDLKG